MERHAASTVSLIVCSVFQNSILKYASKKAPPLAAPTGYHKISDITTHIQYKIGVHFLFIFTDFG